MNKLTLIFAFSFLVLFTTCKKDEGLTEEQSVSYMKYYGAASTGSDMAPTDDGGFIMVGTISSGSTSDYLLVKTDANGNQQWLKTFDGPKNLDDHANSVVVTPSGGYAIIGNTIETDSVIRIDGSFEVTVQRGMLIVTDKFGTMISPPKVFGFGNNLTAYVHDVYANGISMDNTGSNFIIACEINNRLNNDKIGHGLLFSVADYSKQGVIYCFLEDSLGNQESDIAFKDVIHATNGSYVFVGKTDRSELASQGNDNIWMSEYINFNNTDTSGVGRYKILGGLEDDEANSVIENSAGNFIVSGFISQDLTGDKDAAIIECISPISSDPKWESTFGETASENSEDLAYSCFALSDGYIVAGMTQRPDAESQLSLTKLNLTGEKMWTKIYGYLGMDEARAVCETSDGGYVLFGTSTDERGNSNMCLIKTNSSGELKN